MKIYRSSKQEKRSKRHPKYGKEIRLSSPVLGSAAFALRDLRSLFQNPEGILVIFSCRIQSSHQGGKETLNEKIKLVMADVDGTLLDSDQKVDPQTVQAIKDIREQGILFGLCTGREEQSVLNALPEWGIEGLVDVVISSGGAALYDQPLDDRVHFGALSEKTILQGMEHHQDQKVNFVIPDAGILYTTVDDDLIR